jgi:hypothetical protein
VDEELDCGQWEELYCIEQNSADLFFFTTKSSIPVIRVGPPYPRLQDWFHNSLRISDSPLHIVLVSLGNLHVYHAVGETHVHAVEISPVIVEDLEAG